LAPDIRLIALDLDGTLLNPQNQVSDADAAAVRAAVTAGATVVFATSRWHQAARRTAVALGLDGYIISHNGALVRSCDGSRELLHYRIEEGLARELAEHIDSVEGDAYLTLNDRTFIRSRRMRDPSRISADMALASSLADSVTGAPTAFLVFGKDAVRTTVQRFAGHHGRGLNLAEGFSESFPDYLNIVHAEADKGRGLLAVGAALGISPQETMAMGDAAPDIAMIEAAGLGIAMGNAAEAVKASARAVAPSNSEGGVAWAIREYVLK
jgi:Cof subfamily protein (haloacid dehalogenase superfamily)